ncbi:Hpt domain protein [mine drainage metagenome]|uniref:Hpt domain protein n=1 Tax=mine drainage metagenome TaxID=410659 RepID=A0A1J5SX23_9ZZZZ
MDIQDTTLINQDAQAELAQELGQARFDGLVARFLEQLNTQMREIDQALAGADPAGARRVAHGIKGAAGNLGFTGVQAAAHGVEKALLEGADAVLPLADLRTVVSHTRALRA